jgi:hypothetical protein
MVEDFRVIHAICHSSGIKKAEGTIMVVAIFVLKIKEN